MDRWYITSLNGHSHWFDKGKKRSLCGGHQWLHAQTPGYAALHCHRCETLIYQRAEAQRTVIAYQTV